MMLQILIVALSLSAALLWMRGGNGMNDRKMACWFGLSAQVLWGFLWLKYDLRWLLILTVFFTLQWAARMFDQYTQYPPSVR